jgi:hypothetical protein
LECGEGKRGVYIIKELFDYLDDLENEYIQTTHGDQHSLVRLPSSYLSIS